MTYQTLNDIDVQNKKVLLRADLNLPVKGTSIQDETRLERLLPTIEKLQQDGAKIILMSHFGRPKGKRDEKYSLKFLYPVLQEKLSNHKVYFSSETIGDEPLKLSNSLEKGDVLLIENLRFHEGEEKNDGDFAQELAKLADIYVNDAFSCSHRAHASTDKITTYLPKVAGNLMVNELNALSQALEAPKKPIMALVGGSKISTKIDLLKNLIHKVDYLAITGGMANTFLYTQGYPIGKSLCEYDKIHIARDILIFSKEANCQIILPSDVVIADDVNETKNVQTVKTFHVPDDKMILDCGPETIDTLNYGMSICKTLLWNGPLGVFETSPFDQGTISFCKEVCKRTQRGALISIAGGGDTVSAIKHAGEEYLSQLTYVSSAGGAFLEWLEGKELPGVKALSQ